MDNPIITRADEILEETRDATLHALHTEVIADVAVTDSWRASVVKSETTNNSDKTFTVPADTEYQLMTVWVELITTGTVGNRQMEIQIIDDTGDIIARVQASIVQAAGITRYYLFSLTAVDLLAFRDTSYLTTPLPLMILPAGFQIRVYDNKAIDRLADDMSVYMNLNSRTV